jgi:hypothetical protein
VQRIEQRPRLDAGLVEPDGKLVTADAQGLEIHGDGVGPIAVEQARQAGRQGDAVDPAQRLGVLAGDLDLALEKAVELLDLGAAQGGLHVGQPVIEADLEMPVALGRVHAVVAQHTRALRRARVTESNGPTFAGGDQLVGEEAERAGVTDGAARSVLVA